jgi:hypothetical protein
MPRKNEQSFESRTVLILGLPGLLLVVALFYRPVGRLFGWYTLLLFDWCLVQSVAGLAALGIALFRRRLSEIGWSLYFFLGAALPLIVVGLARPSLRR